MVVELERCPVMMQAVDMEEREESEAWRMRQLPNAAAWLHMLRHPCMWDPHPSMCRMMRWTLLVLAVLSVGCHGQVGWPGVYNLSLAAV